MFCCSFTFLLVISVKQVWLIMEKNTKMFSQEDGCLLLLLVALIKRITIVRFNTCDYCSSRRLLIYIYNFKTLWNWMAKLIEQGDELWWWNLEHLDLTRTGWIQLLVKLTWVWTLCLQVLGSERMLDTIMTFPKERQVLLHSKYCHTFQ